MISNLGHITKIDLKIKNKNWLVMGGMIKAQIKGVFVDVKHLNYIV
jgi:hypothetical protein